MLSLMQSALKITGPWYARIDVLSVLVTLLYLSCLPGCSPPPSNSADESLSGVRESSFREAPLPGLVQPDQSAWLKETWSFPGIMAGGCAISDLDGDGLPDLLEFSHRSADRGQNSVQSVTILQQATGLTFVDQTSRSAITFEGIPGGIAVGDYNNDGLPDVLLTGFGNLRLYQNLGGFLFRDVTSQSGFSVPRWGTSAAFFDFDRDGWLDIYVANYVDYDPGHACVDATGKQDFCSPTVFAPTSDRLYRNQLGMTAKPAKGDESPQETQQILFADVSVESGITSRRGAGLGVLAIDWNRDQWIDLFVANDGSPNFLWINQKDGTFADEAIFSGVAFDRAGASQGCMGVATGDLDGNQLPDLVVTNLDGESNAVYLNQGGSFREDSAVTHMSRVSYPFTGFGTALADFNHDQTLDFVVLNGRVRRQTNLNRKAASKADSTVQPSDSSDFWSSYRETPLMLYSKDSVFIPARQNETLNAINGIGRGLAVGDVDLDGDVDLFLQMIDQVPRLLVNENTVGNWLTIIPVEPSAGNRPAVGATVVLEIGEQRLIADLPGGGSYQSTHALEIHFGLGQIKKVDRIQIHWPNGDRTVFPGVEVNQRILIRHEESTTPPLDTPNSENTRGAVQ